MFLVTFFNKYTRQWQNEYARAVETQPMWFHRDTMEIHLAQGILNRDDSRTLFFTENPIYISQQLELPFNEAR